MKRLKASLGRHQLVVLYLAIALGAFVVLLVVAHESPQRAFLIAIPLGVAGLALAFASSWFSPPLARGHGPVRLPLLQALARKRYRLNPESDRIVQFLRDTLAADVVSHEIRALTRNAT